MELLSMRIGRVAEDTDVGFRPDYCGRGTFGRRAPCIVGTETECKAVVSEIVTEITREAMRATQELEHSSSPRDERDISTRIEELLEQQAQVLDYSVDSMGRDICFYWPNLREDA